MDNKKKKILITGSTGFLGSRMAEYYKENYNIYPISHKQMDITQYSQIQQTLDQIQPDYIMHCAAISDTGYCQRHPDESLRINVEASVNLARACQSTPIKLIYMSSDQVYNGQTGMEPHKESEPLTPSSIYGQHKLQAEIEIQEILPTAIGLRLPWMFDLYSADKKFNPNFLTIILNAILKNQELKFPVNDYRGITYVQEIIRNTEKILVSPGGIYNAGSPNEYNTYQLALRTIFLLRQDNCEGIKLIKDKVSFSDAPRNMVMDQQKSNSLGIYYNHSIDSLRECLTAYKVI